MYMHFQQAPKYPPTLKFDIDELINRLTLKPTKDLIFKEHQIKFLLDICREIFLNEKSLVEINAPATICGDIHGQFKDLLRIFKVTGCPSQTNKYVFLGDYVDRGSQSTQCMCLLMAYKIRNPRSIILLRGNHECASLNKAYGFYNECTKRFSLKLWKSFVNCFNCMPAAALIEKKILCMHGGLSPNMFEVQNINKIERPCDIPPEGLLCDLLWADPHSQCQLFGQSSRGAGYLYGKEVVDLFCQLNQIQLIVRAHQIVQDGYQFSFNQKVVTIFSAPNYCDKFNNDCGILKVDSNLRCSITRLSPSYKYQANPQPKPQTQVIQNNDMYGEKAQQSEQQKSLQKKKKRIQKNKLINKIKQALENKYKNKNINRSKSLELTSHNKKLNSNRCVISKTQQMKRRRKSCNIIEVDEKQKQIIQIEDEDDESVYINIEQSQID